MESTSSRSSSVTPLERSTSQLSSASARSGRHTMRTRSRQRARLTSHPSSSTSSIAASDKSLTSFPSFSPESPRDGRPFLETFRAASSGPTLGNRRKPSNPQSINSIVDSLTSTDTHTPKASRNALFEDTPLATNKVPGAIHLADDEHIQRLITRHGATNLVRQIAEDLAQRDVQIANLRRRNDERVRALRKIILECGLSNLDLEKRLREVEADFKAQDQLKKGGLSDMMSDAMEDSVAQGNHLFTGVNDATIRAHSLSISRDNDAKPPGTMRGWKDWILGSGTSKKHSRASSINDENAVKTATRGATNSERRPLEDLFTPLDNDSGKSSSRASSIYSGQASRKPSTSLASMALQLVAGKATGRDGDSVRGRSGSAGQGPGGSLRAASAASMRTDASSRAVSSQGGPKALMAMRRATPAPGNTAPRSRPQERWEAGGTSPPSLADSRPDNSGPVEMDTIFSPEGQPPILTHVYNNHAGSEFLTDTFGFIYDQRRKKRQKEAAQTALQMKRGSRTEMLTGKITISPNLLEDDVRSLSGSIERPDSPFSIDDVAEQGKPRRWQDYLKITTFPTELLSHTPIMTATTLEVFEGAGSQQSPALITSEQRGFVPPANTTAAVNDETAASETARSVEEVSSTVSGQEDTEPVKILLDQLNEVHESLQREKTFKWNEFQRKVRAERRRESEASAAAAAAAAEARYQQAPLILPEAKLTDGELIGVADLGVRGKVGRNKWIEFRNLVLGGIPVALRPKIWSEGCGATFKRIPGYYADLVAKGSDGLDPATITDIDRDIDRTLRDNIFFLRGPGEQKLHEVLIAYARRNPNVGYCQGMNLIAANLLLIMPSTEDTFWILTCMIERMLPEGYFDHSLIASRADQQVLRQYVSQVLPKLSQYLESMYIDLETLTFQWFLSIFTDCLSAEALFRVWDVVLCSNDGSTFLFQVALALLKLNERQLLACTSPSDIYSYINRQMTNHAISIDGLIQASEGLRKEVRREDVEARRKKAIEAERQLMSEREEQREARFGTKALSAPALVTAESASAVPSPLPSPSLRQREDDSILGISVADLRELEDDGELTARTPMPVEEEISLGLG